ncbi:DUF4139 domain-containing protein [Rariglobus hedericola]|uniref:DUF4139 domain-containing protein n=1 Tax=Rariglobus hedericola TaxID=2597822 RepID=A0A556QL81_9BACT|nr:DUF4139 domain-containing protein [Rariglobus hedericola]TSJ77405.1 DUF4139 domain-containing protein [Rariglobus hedericola]
MKTLALFSAFIALLPLSLTAGPALTIYNQNFAVVRETIPFDLKSGVNLVNFSGVTTQVEPDSVVLRDASGKLALRILEQSYRADAASQGLLLAMNEGKELDFIVRDKDAKEYLVKGRVIRSGYKAGGEASTPIIEVDGKLRFSLPGQPIFPSLGDDAILQPTLAWQVNVEKDAKLDAELGYVTGGMSWQAAYNFVAPEKGDQVDIVGWVTVVNNTGKQFTDASIKLMAGDVNRVQPQSPTMRRDGMVMAMAVARQEDVTEKSFDEFHLYSLPRNVTLRDQETKQVEFIRAKGVTAPQLYIFDQQKYGAKVATVREFKNIKENGGLGLPLPKGRTRFYRQDSADGRLEFVGENNIDHTAKNETVRIYTGDVFDIVVERKATDTKMSSRNDFREEAFEVTLRNRKSDTVEVRISEHFYQWPNWSLIEQSDPSEKTDASTAEFRVKLKPDEEKKVTYRVRYDWK